MGERRYEFDTPLTNGDLVNAVIVVREDEAVVISETGAKVGRRVEEVEDGL